MQYYAISELELKQFHMAAIVAGGSREVVPVLDGIRERKISYAAESQKPAHNKQSTPLLFEYTCGVCGERPATIHRCKMCCGA
jgi:hypothetical protein